jgi:hypothetical protein
MTIADLPVGKVISGSHLALELTDGSIRMNKLYALPEVAGTKKVARVTDIRMAWAMDEDKISFWVRLEEENGLGHQFEYPENKA